jgi:CHAD domain-containing protein
MLGPLMAIVETPRGLSERANGRPPVFDGSALRDYAALELDDAIAHLGWHGGRVHEGVHLGRKSLRRTRAVLALGAPALGPGADLIDREVCRINVSLSKMRDAQALVETLDRVIAASRTPAEALPVLRRARRTAAQSRVEVARRELGDDPGLARKRALLATLRAALPALPWDTLTGSRVRGALDVSLARVDSAGARARATGRDSDWHRWRRRVRRLSQQHRALGDQVPEISAAKKRCKLLAELLGEAQDYALLGDHCGRRSIFSELDREALAAIAEAGTRRMRERIEKALVAPADVSGDPVAS